MMTKKSAKKNKRIGNGEGREGFEGVERLGWEGPSEVQTSPPLMMSLKEKEWGKRKTVKLSDVKTKNSTVTRSFNKNMVSFEKYIQYIHLNLYRKKKSCLLMITDIM